MSSKPAFGTIEAQRFALARDFCANLRTVVEGFRFLPPGHPTLASYVERLGRCFSEFREREGPLTIQVIANGLLFDGNPVLTSDDPQDSFAAPLFLDGVTEIFIAHDTPHEELTQLAEIWSASLAAERDAAQSFTTRCWEAGLGGIRIVSVDTFIEHLGPDAERELLALVQTIEDERIAPPVLPAPGDLRPRPERADPSLLLRSGVSEIAPADLDTRPAAPPRFEPLTGDEMKSMAVEVNLERARQSLPAVTALAFAGLEGAAEQRAEAAEAIGAVLVSLARAVGLAQVPKTVTAFVEAARTDRDGPQRRYAALEVVREGLGSPLLLALCTNQLANGQPDAAVDAILSFLTPAAAPALLDCVDTVPAGVRDRITKCLVALQPPAQLLAARIAGVPADVASALLQYANGFAEEERIAAYVAAVAHPATEVRHLAATSVPRDKLLERPELLYPLFDDEDASLRQMAISVLLATRDISAAPFLVRMLDRDDLAPPERRRVIRSLGSMRTRESVAAVRREFRAPREPETRATSALALGRLGDEFSRALLEETVAKLLENKDLKKACAEALRLLDARRDNFARQESA